MLTAWPFDRLRDHVASTDAGAWPSTRGSSLLSFSECMSEQLPANKRQMS